MATMTEIGSASTSTGRRKRSRVETTSPDADVDRRRGRPRVERGDENAGDRRRTQIRMAQRAYRQRKESTLEELRKRVSNLTNTMELMNRHVVDFSARLQASGLSGAQATELEELSHRFEALVRDVRDPTDEISFTPPAAAANSTSSASAAPQAKAVDVVAVPQVRNVPSWLDQSAVSSAANREGPSPTDLSIGYVFSGAAGDDIAMDLGPPLDRSQTTAAPEKITFSNAFFDDDFTPFAFPSPQPAPPRTFSFQESTFARKLHRACLEKAHKLLLEPDIRPATYERVFRLSLLGRSRAKILNILNIILARGPHQELDFWEAPLIHVGGAGTHFPGRDAFGNLLPKRKSTNVGKIGPQTLALLDDASREETSGDLTVEIVGYEGEWFDPGDVQGYLEEKGIFIDPAATFVEADMIVEPSQISSGASNASSARAPTPSLLHDLQDVSTLNDTDTTGWDDLFASAGMTSVGFSDAQTGSFMNFLQPGEAINRNVLGSVPQSVKWTDGWMDALGGAPDMSGISSPPAGERQPRTKKVVIDARKLVNALSTSGVCLGRSPGFRRKEVDHALKLATVDPSSY